MNANRIAFLGLGAMGQRMASRLVSAGHDVVVWSRSGAPESLPHLRERAAASPREAAADADVVISMVSDNAASCAVWDDPETGALPSLRAGAIAIESSTLTPAWVSSLGDRVRAIGAHFLDAPVVGSRPQADAGALIYLVGGSPEIVDRARPVLSSMASAVHHVGPTPAGAVMKLMVNALFGVQVAVVGELLGLAGRTALDAGKAFEIMASLPVMSPAAKAAGAAMLAGRFEPMFPVALVEKDFRYALTAGGAAGSELPVIARTAELFGRAMERGLGAENLTALAKLYA